MSKKYNKPFLTKVLMRLDFASNVSNLDRVIPNELKNKIMDHFPIFEPQDIIAQELMVSPMELREKKRQTKEWVFFDEDKVNKIILTPQFLSFVIQKYTSFESTYKIFIGIVETLFNVYNPIQASRIGLRYINNVDIRNEKDPLNWEEYLNKDLLSIFEVFDRKDKICKALHILCLNFGNMILSFQYGMHNPDYPATIRQKLFILDYDASSNGLYDLNDVKNNVGEYHEKVQEVFELSIKDNLRNIMEPIDNE
jgi:uncharacterized protein (TIGR04255 family)